MFGTDVLPPVTVIAPRPNPFSSRAEFGHTASLDATLAIRYPSITQLLQTFPGVTLRQWGSEGHWTTVQIRGASSKQVGVQVDAIGLLSPSGIVDLSELPLPLFGRLTVLRGTHADKKTGHGFGGVVAFDTAQVDTPQFFTRYGSFGTIQGGMSAPFVLATGQLNLSVAGLHSNGDFYFINNQNTPANPNDDVYQPLANNDVTSWHGRAQYRLTGENPADFQLWGSLIDNGLAGSVGRLTSRTRLAVNRYRAQSTWHPDAASTGILYFENRRQAYSDPEGEFFGAPYSSTQGMFQVGGSYCLLMIGEGLPLQTNLGVGVITLDDAQFGYPSRLSLETTMQAEHLWEDATLSVRVNLGYHSDVGMRPSGALGLWMPLSETLAFKGNLSTAIRLPTFSEKYSQYALFRANPSLRPESALEADGGLVWDAVGWTWEAAYFSRWMTDLIETTVVSVWIQSQNVSAAHVQGLELSGTTTWGPLHGSVNAIIQQGKVLTAGNNYGAPLRDFPPAKIALQTRYVLSPQWSAYSDVTWTSERPISFYEALPSQTQVDLNLVWQPQPTQLIGLSVRNLFDDRAQDQYGFPLPGRSVSVQSSWTLS